MGPYRAGKRRGLRPYGTWLIAGALLIVCLQAYSQESPQKKAPEKPRGRAHFYRCSEKSLMREIEVRNFKLGENKYYSEQTLIYQGPVMEAGEIKIEGEKYEHQGVIRRRYWKTKAQLALGGYQKKTVSSTMIPSDFDVAQLLPVTGSLAKIPIEPGSKGSEVLKWQRIKGGKKSEATYKYAVEIGGRVPFNRKPFAYPETKRHTKIPVTGIRILLKGTNVKDAFDAFTYSGIWSKSLETYLSYTYSSSGITESCQIYFTENI